MADGININVGTENSSLERSNVTIGDIAGGDLSRHDDSRKFQAIFDENAKLIQRVHELEQFVFGDTKLGLVGIRQELNRLRFWVIFNSITTFSWAIYEIFRKA